MTSKEITAAVAEDEGAYTSELHEYEAGRRAGKRYRGEKSTKVTSECRQGLATRKLLGYLWEQSLLKKHGEVDLWESLPKQSVLHMNKMCHGVLREKFVPGAIEIFETSNTEAVRAQVAADCEPDEQDQADQAFQMLGQAVKLTTCEKEGGDGEESAGLTLKHSKRAKVDEDDLMSLWGLGGPLASTGASSSRGNKDEGAGESKPKRPRTASSKAHAKQHAKEFSSGSSTDPFQCLGGSSDTASQAEVGVGDFGQGASWLFGVRSRGPKGKGGGKSGGKAANKDLDATEKVLQQHESLKQLLAADSTFLTLTFQKMTAHSEKLHSRRTPELQKTYRELCAGSTDGRACEVMKKMAAAMSEVSAMCQFVSAFKDQEAAAETMQEGLTEARDAGLDIPTSADKMCKARLLLQLAKAGQHKEFLLLMQSNELEALFGAEKDEFVEFQFCSFKSAISNILNEEVEAPGFENLDKDTTVSPEEKQRRETAKSSAPLSEDLSHAA